MTHNFCTLFDRNYFFKGLTMYNSLIKNHTEDFNLWILCMDDLTYELLKKMSLPKIKLISLNEFEDENLLKIKKERTVAEYSWTCASNFMWFILQKKLNIESIIYLDADLYFFNNAKPLIDEIGQKDVLITEHRYTEKYKDSEKTSGKYCVQFMIFKNNTNGLNILNWWRKACLDWCFAYFDNNRFGDQKYLDDWLERFNNVHELKHLGGGVAPWNVQQYDFFIKDNIILGQEKSKSSTVWPLIFYHFHSFKLISENKYFPILGYDISKKVKDIVYEPYFKALQDSINIVKKFDPKFAFGFRKVTTKEKLIDFCIKIYKSIKIK